MSDWENGRRELSREDIDAIVTFLPVLEQPGRAFGEWHPYRDERTGRALQRRMFAIRDDPERMARARLETMRKMLITYVRADRFCDGALVEACEQGYIQAILRRVKEIAEGRRYRVRG